MKHTPIYLLLFLLLTLGAVVVVVMERPSTLNKKDTAFGIDDTAQVGKIAIADMQGHKVVLQRVSEGQWIINDKFPARRDYIETLLGTIKRVTASYPVPESAQSTVVKAMASNNKRVEIFDRKGKRLKAYYVGGATLDQLGTYMMMVGSEKPYVVVIPGFFGTVHTRYATDEERIRDTNILRFTTRQLREIQLTYLNKPDSSFLIRMQTPDTISLFVGDQKPVPNHLIDREKVLAYLRLFRSVNAETFANTLPKKDSILGTSPYAILSVTPTEGPTRQLTLFRMPRTQHTVLQYDSLGNPVLFDPDRYYAWLEPQKEFMIVQQFHFGPLLRNGSYFLNTAAKPVPSLAKR